MVEHKLKARHLNQLLDIRNRLYVYSLFNNTSLIMQNKQLVSECWGTVEIKNLTDIDFDMDFSYSV